MTINDYEMKYQVRIELKGDMAKLEKKLKEDREITNDEFVEMGFPIPKKKLKAPTWFVKVGV